MCEDDDAAAPAKPGHSMHSEVRTKVGGNAEDKTSVRLSAHRARTKTQRDSMEEIMRHLMKYLTAPLAFAAVFLLFGTPSAPGLAGVEALAGVSVGVGGYALAYGPGEDQRDLPDPYNPPSDSCESGSDAFGEAIYIVAGVIGFAAGVAALSNPVGILIGMSIGFGGFGVVMSTLDWVIDTFVDDC